jgi:hypothetical protein
MPRAAYHLELELAYGVWTDVTADVHARTPIVIERGLPVDGAAADVGWMTLALHNPDGRYDPDDAGVTAGFEVGIGVRLRAVVGEATAALFYGHLVDLAPHAPEGAPLARLVCWDDVARLRGRRLEAFPLFLNTGPKPVVNWLVDASFRPPGVVGYWQLGHAVDGRLGQTTKLPDTYTGKDFDDGQSTFPWVGDSWRDEVTTAHDSMAVACASEGGRFYLAADGTPVFEDRHARPTHVAVDAAFDADWVALTRSRRRALIANRVEVTVWPRAVGDEVEVLWALGHEARLEPNAPREIRGRYVDPSQQAARVGAWEMAPLAEGVDYAAATKKNAQGKNVTEYVTVEAAFGGNSVVLTLTSAYPKPVYVHTLQVRGKALRAYLPVTAVVEDAESRAAHGLLVLRRAMPLQDDVDVAVDVGHALLTNRKDPHTWFEVVVEATVSGAMLAQAVGRDVGDRIAAPDGAEGFIEWVRHEIARGGASHRVTWRTLPADLEAYWILGQSGRSELGVTARLGY